MAGDTEDLDPGHVHAAVVDLIRMAVTWETGKADQETHRALETFLRETVARVLDRRMRLPLARAGKSGKHVVREQDLWQAPAFNALVGRLTEIHEGTFPEADGAMGIAQTLATHGLHIEPDLVARHMRVRDRESALRYAPAAWITEHKDVKEAARTLWNALVGRSRSQLFVEKLAGGTAFGSLEVRAQALGTVIGRPGIAAYALRALGYGETAVAAAVDALLAHARETDKSDAPR